jgi:hypothetical protein
MYIDLDLTKEAASRATVTKGAETVHLTSRKKKKKRRDKTDKTHSRLKEADVRPRVHVRIMYISAGAQDLPMELKLLEKQRKYAVMQHVLT